MAIINQFMPCSSQDNATLAAFDGVIDQYLRYSTQTMSTLEVIQGNDPDFALGHLFRGYQLKMASDPRFSQPLAQSLQAAEQTAGNAREQAHVAALKAWHSNDTDKTSAILGEILTTDPTDLIALKASNHLHFYRGDAKAMLRAIQDSLPHWPQDHPWRSFIVGMQAFGFEECGDYNQALACGHAAVDAEPLDMWAAHAVAHVHQMQGDFEAGIDWIDDCLPSWAQTNNFSNHLIWHKALMLIDLDQAEQALKLFDEALVDCLTDDFYLDVCNAASLLWRLDMKGLDLGERWSSLTPYYHRAQDQELVFIALHYFMVAVKNGDQDIIEKALSNLSRWAQQPEEQGRVCRAVGLETGKALIDLTQGTAQRGVDQLISLEPELHRIGGSHAQRALFKDFIHHYS